MATRGTSPAAVNTLGWMRRSTRFAAAIVLAILGASAPILLADPASPISIAIVDTPDPVASGAQLLYTITMANTGGAKITNVLLSNQVNGVGGIGVPPQLQITSTRGSCTQSGNLVNCNAGTIEGNGSWVVTIRGVVTAASGTVLNETATVSGTKSAQNFTTTSTAATLVSGGSGTPLPDLTLAKAGPTTVVAGAPMTYTLTVNNVGTANATGVRVVDTVPAGLTSITAAGTSLFVCGVAGQTVTCDGGAVNQGSNATVTINAKAPATAGTITNTAVVDPNNTIIESDELNNTSALVNTAVTATPPPPTGLSINATDGSEFVPGPPPAWAVGAGPDPVKPGQTLTYKIHVVNTSTGRADDVRIVNGTQGLVASSITASQTIVNGSVGTFGGCTVAGSQVTCSIKTLNAGGTMDMTITGQVITSAGSTIFDTATVTGNISNKGVTATDSEITAVRPGVDLTITKADSPDPVCAASWPAVPPGPPNAVCLGGLTYTFVVGNSGIEDATNVVVRDPLPAGVIFDHVTIPGGFACAYDAPTNVLTCTGNVPAQSTRTFAVVAVVPPALGSINNTVTVDPNNAIFEADETNNTFTQTTQIKTGVDLTIAKTSNHAADFVATRGTLTYTITVTNLGTQDATNIRVRDTLPADTIFRDAIADPTHGFSCSQSSGVVSCTGGRLQGTQSMNYPNLAGVAEDKATITVRIFATPYEQPAMHNEAVVDPLGQIAEVNETNNLATQDTKVQKGGFASDAFNELTISKTQQSPAPSNTARNAVVTYIVKVGNDGTDPVTGIKVRDTLPAGSKYIEASGTNSFLCTQGVVGFVDCTGGQLPAHTTPATEATITIRMFAPDTPGTYLNQVQVDPDHAIVEGDEFNNSASAQTVVKNGGDGSFNDLQIQKTGTATITPGGEIDYTLKVWNVGTDPAAHVTVRDVLPAGVTFVSASDSGGPGGPFTCSAAAAVVTCSGGTINGGTSLATARTITIVATAPNHPIDLLNEAVVDPDNTIPEGDELNNTSTAPTSVVPQIDLTVQKSGPTVANQSSVGDYSIKVKNNKVNGAGQNAIGVVMHDPLPVGLIPLAIDAGSGNNWACQITGSPINVADCLGDLTPDQEVTIKITVFVSAESGRSLDNTACVDPGNAIAESNEFNNCSEFSSAFGPTPKLSPDILVSKNVNKATATPGDADLEYTIAVSNVGTAKAATGLTVVDTLPPDETFINATASNGWTCTQASPVTCTDGGSGLDVGESTTITIHASINPSATVPLVNTALAQSPVLPDLTGSQCAPDPSQCEKETADHKANNSATATTSVGGSGFDFVITSITDSPDPVNKSDALTYTIVAINAGTEATPLGTPVHVRVDIPPSTAATFVGADGTNGFTCGAPVSNAVDCSGDMPAGGSTVITVKLAVVGAPPPTLTLVATIDPANEFVELNEGNNQQTEVTTVSNDVCTPGCIDIVAAQLLPSVDPVQKGHDLTVTFTVVNTGDTPADFGTPDTPGDPLSNPLLWFDIVSDGPFTLLSRTSSNPAVTCVTDPLSGGTSLFSDCAVDHNGAAAGGTILNPGEGVTISIKVHVVDGTEITATGTADPKFKVIEAFETNNGLTRKIKINP